MNKYYLAVDIGASSGRHILGWIQNGSMVLEEIYRFENGMEKKDGSLCWDTGRLFSEIVTGMKKCSSLGKIPVSMGIDTWAVDYVLLDQNDKVIGKTYAYRDKRTEGMDRLVYDLIPKEDLYQRTGIQKQPFNTVYQLMAVKQKEPEVLETAETFLMLPDYFHFLLTGRKVSDYTNASSTQLVNPLTFEWDRELINKLGYPEQIFLPLSMPGCSVGELLPKIRDQVGYSCQVVLPPTHDTACAVLAVPSQEEDFLYISSGTWSLMGVERKTADCSCESMENNFTNEGGYDRKFRYLKNIMGLWMIQSVRHECGDTYSFAELCRMAKEHTGITSRVDVNDDCFLSPLSMIEAIREYCRKTSQKVPTELGEIAAVIYQSLADSYADTVLQLEKITKRNYTKIHIVGGGSHADYLNQLTAEKTGKAVIAGPGEATAIGNLSAQMIANGVFKDVAQARSCIQNSFGLRTYQ